MSATRKQRGFTLLEVVIAVVILATALGLLLGMLSRGMRQVTQAQSESEAAMYAQSTLDQLGTLGPLEPGTQDGDYADGAYRWTLSVAPTTDPAPPPPPQPGAPPPQAVALEGSPVLYRVRLDVAWGRGGPGQQLRFDTLRLRAPSQDSGDEQPIDAAGDAAASDAASAGAGR